MGGDMDAVYANDLKGFFLLLLINLQLGTNNKSKRQHSQQKERDR